ncbi:hypothetical protein HDV00_001984 [Rhizophlyctis rosea]|nr:hypothetical protein HDV00_001984 [Rhizophlyctis rosea]
MTPSATGTAEWKDQYKEYEMSIRIDVDAAQNFLHHLGTYGVACVKITGTEAPLFRSEIVPLWFLRTLATLRKPPRFLIVSLPTPVGGTSVVRSAVSKERIEDNLLFGQHLHRFLAYQHQRVAVVLSGDLAHTHATNCAEALYLPDPSWKLPVSDAAAVFDAMVEKWAQTLNRDFLTKDAGALVSKAISCGFDGFVVLQGLMEREGLKHFESQIFARHRPSYFGMMAAVFAVPRQSMLRKRKSFLMAAFSGDLAGDHAQADAFEMMGRKS